MTMDQYISHYGTPRHSGRYPWGSGENPYQHEAWFNAQVSDLRKEGMTEKEIADSFGMSINELRNKVSIAKDEQIQWETQACIKLKDKGYSHIAIGEALGIPESTVRNRLNPVLTARASKTQEVADILKDQVADKKYLDIGAGVSNQLGISSTKLNTAIDVLKEQGYKVQYIKVEQATNPGKYTSIKVLVKDDTPYSETYANRDKIKSPDGVYIEDGVKKSIQKPVSVGSDRIKINYYEDGGIDKDGVIELRPGVSDISLGNNHYAQVRIAVDDTHYLKGMAMYSDKIPDGYDIVFNTNKHRGTDKMDVLKELKNDPDNPFGAIVKQREYVGADGKKHLSAINIVNSDEDWGHWQKSLSSQMLSKQRPEVAEKQLNLRYDQKKAEFDEICALTNPVVKRKLLESFADSCDSEAVHLKAAGFPRQRTHVILPVTSLKDNEVYAPNYKDGEEVVLVRYPHGGTFEMPRLIVNNRNKEGRTYIANAENAIGINSHVAAQLSGADFDGDTVTVIPTKGQKINTRTSATLKKLQDFDPKEAYPAYEGMPEVSKKTGFHKQTEMGKVSNLITDMTLKGANDEELVRAVKHSMVVIDAEKHNLNWRQSYTDNGIAALKEKYQGGPNRGAATLISRAKSQARIPARKEVYSTKNMTPEQLKDYYSGKKIYVPTGETYTNKAGKELLRTEKTTKMMITDDAYSLSSGTTIEDKYAKHANKMKALANDARKELISTGKLTYSPSAKVAYSEEVKSLNSSLQLALRNSPKERQAQLVASKIIQAKKRDNPDMSHEEKKKMSAIALDTARRRTGASGVHIELSDREWEAIQAGAISDSKLTQIIKYVDLDDLQKRATPRPTKAISNAKLSRAKALLRAGYTWAEVEEATGLSSSTLQEVVNS